MRHPLTPFLSLCVLACSRATPPPPPSITIEAEVHVKASDPSSSCILSGAFQAPRRESQRIAGGTDWKGTATVSNGDLVVLDAHVDGVESWSCEVECTVRQVGARVMTTSTAHPLPSRPAPTCPVGHAARATCVLKAESPRR